MISRSKKLVLLAQRVVESENPRNNISPSKLEMVNRRTKEEEKTTAEWKTVGVNYDSSVSEDKTSGSEYIPETSSESSCNICQNANESGKAGTNEQVTLMETDNYISQKVNKWLDTTYKMKTTNLLDKNREIDIDLHRHGTEARVSCDNVIDGGKENNVLKERELDNKSMEIKRNYTIPKLVTEESTSCNAINEKNKENDNMEVENEVIETDLDSFEESNAVTIRAAEKKSGKRIRNKVHYCYFCYNKFQNMARHFEKRHGEETTVAKVLAMPKNSKRRKDGFGEIIRAGDFTHNCDVMSLKRGELVLVRRPTENEWQHVSYSDYGPCPHCLGFMLKKHLWHHIKTGCTKAENETSSKTVIAESNAILNEVFGAEFSNTYIKEIVTKLRDDEIGEHCKSDKLILKFGAMQFEKYATTQGELIRQTMRQLSRLVIKIQETLKNKFLSLIDLINPEKFDALIHGTKLLCVCNTHINGKRPEFSIPSLALKLGYALKKCAAIQRGVVLKRGDLNADAKLKSFLHLMELEWSTRISSNALSTLYKRKLNATQLLPLTSDLVKLSKYIDIQLLKCVDNLSSCNTTANWTDLATMTLARIILFNKRRSGEASRMTLHKYISRPLWSEQSTDEMKNCLTPFEKKLAEMLTIEIEGKRGKKVPVLLTEETKTSIDLLVKLREVCGISTQNPFIFARAKNSTDHMRGHDCLGKVCSEAELQNPSNVTSTKLRKYIATVCQIFNLKENEHDWLARHLGHDIRVHREFYRLHESAVELTKVSRLLIAVDQGEASKFAGKELQDINLEDLPGLEEDECNETEHDEQGKQGTNLVNEDMETENEDTIIVEQYPEKESVDNQGTNKVNDSKKEIKDKNKPKGKTCIKVPWSTDEREAVLKFFKVNVKNGIVPGKAKCVECMEQNPLLSARSWTNIKFCVKNEISKRNRKMNK